MESAGIGNAGRKPKLTVGMPVYNGMPHLPAAVASLLNQSYADYEILVVDDGSTDDSLAYLRSVGDPKLRVLTQSNRGMSSSLNRILEESRTDWLVRHDADDVAFPSRLSTLDEHVQRFPDAGMFYTYARYIGNHGSFGTFRTTTAGPSELRQLTRAGYLLAVCHPTVCLNVKKTHAVGGYRFDLHGTDVDLWWRMALAHDIHLVPEYTIGCRLRSGSIGHEHLAEQSRNNLYVQYLLISHLRGLSPLPFEEVKGPLTPLVDRRKLQFRHWMRRANIAYGERCHALAFGRASRAFLASPRHFLRRCLYEAGPKTPAVNFAEPELFAAHADTLWPG